MRLQRYRHILDTDIDLLGLDLTMKFQNCFRFRTKRSFKSRSTIFFPVLLVNSTKFLPVRPSQRSWLLFRDKIINLALFLVSSDVKKIVNEEVLTEGHAYQYARLSNLRNAKVVVSTNGKKVITRRVISYDFCSNNLGCFFYRASFMLLPKLSKINTSTLTMRFCLA